MAAEVRRRGGFGRVAIVLLLIWAAWLAYTYFSAKQDYDEALTNGYAMMVKADGDTFVEAAKRLPQQLYCYDKFTTKRDIIDQKIYLSLRRDEWVLRTERDPDVKECVDNALSDAKREYYRKMRDDVIFVGIVAGIGAFLIVGLLFVAISWFRGGRDG
ncbi:MAG: hypothetical protein AB7G15_09510 [Alphaproteobacteria bacterium]